MDLWYTANEEVKDMAKQTESQKRAHTTYISKFARLEIRTTKEKQLCIQAHAENRGESVNGFVNRAIQETMERDNAASGGAAGPSEAKPD